MAIPLTRYLNASGRYEGFDIVASGIKWCREKITPLYPNFHFQLADVYNHMYHQQGKHKASEYRFPFEAASFDFVFLTSVFTHMFPCDMENYLAEIANVLKPGGRCLITYFLWNAEAQANTNSKSTDLKFQFLREGYRIADEKEPEYAVALPEQWLRERYSDYGLKIQEPIRYGSWSGRPNPTSYQDIVLAVKL
jgi:SAM-dependent methyltransferase